jgi:hypothetical protein
MNRDVPGIGAHRDEILAKALGLDSGEVARLADAGAFGTQATKREARP